MKLIVGIVNKDDAVLAQEALVSQGYRVTTAKTTGGFLHKENVTLFTGVGDEEVAETVQLIQENCHTRVQKMGGIPSLMASGELYILEDSQEVEVGGAVIFVLDVAQFIKS
ncbi:MAG: cyclic-di-AMP receptor [Anaerolineae bacterium]|nr:cyclic-di-AMP receptor [Anaerolineae bacterium]